MIKAEALEDHVALISRDCFQNTLHWYCVKVSARGTVFSHPVALDSPNCRAAENGWLSGVAGAK